MNCRHCNHQLEHVFLDLGYAPPSNAYIAASKVRKPETYFPLKLYVCDECWLVQTEDYAAANELFDAEYAYFSSVSSSWLDHAARYVTKVTERFAWELNLPTVLLLWQSQSTYPFYVNFLASRWPSAW